ncbi:MAG: hypothetical protein U9R75_00415 [Candidatus Thermoplasmatota archaeon]|nr:hypothetical protein [Candidatus Thermoplasmatota archaeon]
MQRKKEPKISLYFSLLEDGTLLILSNARKSDQIPERVHPIFDKEEDVYNLSVPPKYMIDMVGDLVGEKKRGIVTNFHGKYIPGTGKRSKIRPDITRNASYHGEDGYDTLKEWSHYYGIFPNIITLHFFNGLQVKLDSRGIFSIFKGKASDFLPILYPIIEYNQRIKKQIEKDSRYELIELKGSEGERTVGLEYPWNIRFDNVLAMSKYDSILKETSSMHKISYLSKIVNDDSRFLLADIIDDLKKVKMELRIKDNDIMIYPVERSDIGANLRMFDIISGNIDIRAEVR